jgi:hypothetical protein
MSCFVSGGDEIRLLVRIFLNFVFHSIFMDDTIRFQMMLSLSTWATVKFYHCARDTLNL